MVLRWRHQRLASLGLTGRDWDLTFPSVYSPCLFYSLLLVRSSVLLTTRQLSLLTAQPRLSFTELSSSLKLGFGAGDVTSVRVLPGRV